jgi:glycosyltransferase involved in cell wall biosynthesis
MAKLCLNMIVRNEADKMERCLTALAPYISCYSITDTGSTDDTLPTIIAFFAKRDIPGHVHSAPFEDFSQARNAALDNARSDPLEWDYLLLCDADMELVVEDKDFARQLTGQAHNLIQKGSGVAYENVRFISRAATGKYIGVTHEYLDIPSSGTIKGAWYIDHADGSNRPNKFKRDIRLLKRGLFKEPNNGRYWFYLAQSYQDAGRWDDAIRAFDRRIALGGWDEETYLCKFRRAQCYGQKGHTEKYVSGLIDAYNFRPHRAEALYDLAHHYRMKGQNFPALMVAEEGLRLKPSGDVLFVNEFPVQAGFREEFSIAGWYDESRRAEAFKVTNWLALDPKVPDYTRAQARANLVHYVKPLCESVPSFVTRRIAFEPPDGFTAMNPCVTIAAHGIKCLVRTVNYTMDEAGRYLIKGTNGEANGTNPINTRNFLLSMEPNFDVKIAEEVLPPEGFPPPSYNLVVGFEDMRVFEWRGNIWSISNVREQNPEGWCEQVLAMIPRDRRLQAWKKILPANRQHEKNWAPIVTDDELRFVYNIGATIDPETAIISKHSIQYAADNIRGGTQYIPFRGGYLALTHEAYHHSNGKRYYLHRFSYVDVVSKIWKLSAPFVFHEKVIEFAAGIAMHPSNKQILISYGREDKEAWIASVDETDVAEFLFQ